MINGFAGIIFGLSAAWFGEITIAEGKVVQRNFHDYRMIRLADAPAVTNGIFAATGIRVLPICNTKLARGTSTA